MIISIERSGGVTGISLQKTINTASLPLPKAKKIETSVAQSDFFSLSSQRTTNAPDRFQYTITIEQESEKHTVTFTEETLPTPLQTLLKSF